MNLELALKIFGLTTLQDIDSEQLKILYKNLAKLKHPDRLGGSSQEFVQLQEAYFFLQQQVDQQLPSGKNLKKLTGEEILQAYYRDTGKLQLKLNSLQESSQDTLQKTREKVEEIVEQFDGERNRLKLELEKKVLELEKKHAKSFFKRFLPFLPGMSEEEFWDKYHKEVQKYSRLHADLDMEFFKQMLDVYGDGLNKISTILNNLQ